MRAITKIESALIDNGITVFFNLNLFLCRHLEIISERLLSIAIFSERH